MKALTLRQPWAWAVLHAGKWVENRTWRPPLAMIGEPFALHAGFKEPEEADVATALRRASESGLELERPAAFLRGCIVGVATISGFVEVNGKGQITTTFPDASPLAQAAIVSPWFTGPVGMFLADVRALATAIPCRGMLGFWALAREAEGAVRDQLAG